MTGRMRAIALGFGLAVATATAASAQVAIGLTGGVNSAKLNGSGVDTFDISSQTGGSIGAYANIYLGKRFSVEGQLLFAGQGVKVDGTDVTQGYIEVPALLKVYFGHLNLFAGPVISWQVSCTIDVTAATSCDTANTSLWSGELGAGLQFGRLGVEGHYQSGFSDTFDNVNASYGVWSLMGRFAILGSR